MRISLAEQIREIAQVAPKDFDPDELHFGQEEQDKDNDAATEHYLLELGPSALRKAQDSLSDPKYSGKRVSRTQLLADVDEQPPLSDSQVEDSESDDQSQASQEDESDTSEPSPRLVPQPDAAQTLNQTRQDDQKKGLAVSRQLSLWESLLDARIRFQKVLAASNLFPSHAEFDSLVEQTSTQDAIHALLDETLLLSEDLFQLQEYLLETNGEIAPPPRKRIKIDQGGDYAAAVSSYSGALADIESAYHPHLVQTLSKWSNKIQSVAPSVLLPSNRNAFTKSSRNEPKNAVQLISESFSDQTSWTKMVDRTRVYRGKGERIGSGFSQHGERDPEVFDDTDFYQQLLRDVIDARNGGSGSQDWIQAQKERKKRKVVDTKASKGRKIRYEVQAKLQNFMVPIPVTNGWHEEQIDELFSSLLGKGFQEDDINTPGQEEQPTRAPVDLTGFRVFG
ncbi:apoptosis-antagonizing transcription factor [Thelephora terrestris]|uniref:Protein BFR2 n=1 Tax=Thelephora terrestris TaxID=56493 RepID=A0A9P6HGP3_9AGAM|nr:apoptosis-antagonizing transcription factor [Thelephora terrestris]